MIPKTIHYCWFSNDPVPAIAAGNLANWEKVLGSSYNFVKWDEAAIRDEIPAPNQYLQHAIDNKRYAFIADYIRYYTVHKFGGIYLDMDVRLFRNFDAFLTHPFFSGWECWPRPGMINTVAAHCFGAMPGHPFLKQVVDAYEREYDEVVAPAIMRDILAADYGLTNSISKDMFWQTDTMTFYPFHFFDRAKHYLHYNEIVAFHQHMYSWRQIKK